GDPFRGGTHLFPPPWGVLDQSQSIGLSSGPRLCKISRDQPIVQAQSRYIAVIRRIVRYQRQVVDQGDRRDQQVHSADGDTLLQQRSSDLAEPFGAGRVEVE